MIDLLDANLWLALAHEGHTHHARARHYWETESLAAVAFCRVTQMAFFRLLTNKAVMREHAISPDEAWRKGQDFLALPEVLFINEPPGLNQCWHEFIKLGRSSPNLWTDAYLAAFAKSSGLRLVTFDRDFAAFPGLDVLTLSQNTAEAPQSQT